MRIVYVLTSLGMGGAERQALAVAGCMVQAGHAVALLILSPRLAEQWPTTLPTTHLDLRRSPLSLLASLRAARHFLRQFRPDILHSHSFHANFFARLLKLSSPGTQVISTVHNVYEGPWHRMALYRLTDPLSSLTVAVSHAAAARFVNLHAIPRRKCAVIPNGINPAGFTPDPARRVEMRQQMDAGDDFIWLAAGRLVPAKDYPNLLRAFSQVCLAHPNAQLWIAGEWEPEELSGMERFAEDLGHRAKIRFLGLRRDLPALLDAADAFVNSSAWEGMPLAIAEAMAMEKPIVATDVGGTRELAAEDAALVPPRNAEPLAAAMLHLMQTTPEGRRNLGQASRERILAQFTIDAAAEHWESLYQTLLNSK